MKKIILLTFASLFLIAEGSFAKKKVVPVPEPVKPVTNVLTNDVDSMSYALGVNVGSDFIKSLQNIPGGKTNIDLIIKGFTESMKKDSTLMSLETSQNYFQNYITTAQKKDNDLKKQAGEKFLAENKLKSGVVITPSGLQYEVIQMGAGAKPLPTDSVKVNYTGSTIDGNVFDSSVQRGEPAQFVLNQVIPGWTEGLQLMPVGSKFKFYIPYNLAYGEQGIPQAKIPPFAPLIFDVELLDIHKPVTPSVEEIKPATLKTTKSKSVSKKK